MKKLLFIGGIALLAWLCWQGLPARSPQVSAVGSPDRHQALNEMPGGRLSAKGQVLEGRSGGSKAKNLSRKPRPNRPLGTQSTTVTVGNTSDQPREVRLFGAHQGTAVSAPLVSDVEDHQLSTGQSLITPQGMAWHPGLGGMLVCSQVADELLLLNGQHGIIRRFALSAVAGTFSPVAVWMQPENGNIWVLGTVADQVRMLSSEGSLLTTIPTGRRPTRLIPHPHNGHVLIYESLDQSLLILDYEGVAQGELFLDAPLLDATVDGAGRLILDLEGWPVRLVYDASYQPLQSLLYPEGQLLWLEEAQALWLADRKASFVYRLDASGQPFPAIPLTAPARQLLYNPANAFVYALLVNGQLTVLDTAGVAVATIGTLPVLDYVVNPAIPGLYAADPVLGTLYVLGYAAQSSKVPLSEGYAEKARAFQNHPARIRRLRLSQQAAASIRTVQLITRTATGQQETKTLSLSHFQSPWHAQAIMEIDSLQGQTLDGQTEICFQLPAMESVTVGVEYD